MARGYITINEAAHQWVGEFNAIPQGMIAKLMQSDPEDWHEVTLPSCGDRVYVYNLPDEVDTLEHGGTIAAQTGIEFRKRHVRSSFAVNVLTALLSYIF